MTSAVAPARVRVPGLGRAAAVLALGSTVVHLLLVDVASLGALVMAGLGLLCLPCAWHLWRLPTAPVWGLTATLDLAMLAVHAQLLAAGGHHSTTPSWMWVGAVLIIGQLSLAGFAFPRR